CLDHFLLCLRSCTQELMKREPPRCFDRLLKRTRVFIVLIVFAFCLGKCTLELKTKKTLVVPIVC
ncbi:MAG: hypothetical protein LBF76_02765, partial [Holosporales bacterium]|nr:hypothetical protein [Holosporales bacterium]